MDRQHPYPTVRLDALTDGIFSVAMTLLVLDVRLPDDFDATTDGDLLRGLLGLVPKFLPYVLSFLVLGVRWLASIETRNSTETVTRAYAVWMLVYLLLITCVPFSTMVVGRYASLSPAIWLYAGNTALVALVAFFVLRHTAVERDDATTDREVSLIILALSSALAIIWTFINVHHSLLFFALNGLSPFATRLLRWRSLQSA